MWCLHTNTHTYDLYQRLSYFQEVFLTTVALSISQLSSDEIFHPEGMAHTTTSKRVTLSMAGAV